MSEFEYPPPPCISVDERRPVLHLPGGRVVYRVAGFVPAGVRMQTTGTFPQLTTPRPGKKTGGKKGGKKC